MVMTVTGKQGVEMDGCNIRLDEHRIVEEPYYLAQKNEVEIACAAYKRGLPLLLKGPTGCGKTRFMQYLAWKLERPLITVSCHDDLSTSDLVGRYLIRAGEAVWMDGPLTLAVRAGGIFPSCGIARPWTREVPSRRQGCRRSCACKGVHIAGWKSPSGGTFTRL